MPPTRGIEDTVTTITPEAAALRHENARLRRELAALKAVCTRHEHALDGLTRALRELRQGALALRAENVDLRATIERPAARKRRSGRSQPREERARPPLRASG
jgi:regulator of replication initiation timing